MKKNDWILAGTVIAAALCLFLFQFFNRTSGSFVVVTVDGHNEQAYSLSQDQRIPIEGDGGVCVLEISSGKAYITEADCPDKLCVARHAISKNGEVIACLPNRILVRVENGSLPDYDAVAR